VKESYGAGKGPPTRGGRTPKGRHFPAFAIDRQALPKRILISGRRGAKLNRIRCFASFPPRAGAPAGPENREVPFMPIPLDAPEVLDREFLEIRARLLQIAASLDRLDRAKGSVASDPRLQTIRQALAILADSRADRAEKIQLLFSRPYEAGWRAVFERESKKTDRAPAPRR
jgi:hypothetical protein